jgi:hypothetical protein
VLVVEGAVVHGVAAVIVVGIIIVFVDEDDTGL